MVQKLNAVFVIMNYSRRFSVPLTRLWPEQQYPSLLGKRANLGHREQGRLSTGLGMLSVLLEEVRAWGTAGRGGPTLAPSCLQYCWGGKSLGHRKQGAQHWPRHACSTAGGGNRRNKGARARPPTVQAWVYYAVRPVNDLIFFNNFKIPSVEDTHFINESIIKISGIYVETQADPGLEL